MSPWLPYSTIPQISTEWCICWVCECSLKWERTVSFMEPTVGLRPFSVPSIVKKFEARVLLPVRDFRHWNSAPNNLLVIVFWRFMRLLKICNLWTDLSTPAACWRMNTVFPWLQRYHETPLGTECKTGWRSRTYERSIHVCRTFLAMIMPAFCVRSNNIRYRSSWWKKRWVHAEKRWWEASPNNLFKIKNVEAF